MSATEVTPIAAVEETVQGLFGAARCNDGTTIWCRARKVLERHLDGASTGWRDMTMDDVDRLLALGAIDRGTRDRMEVRLLR